MTSLSTNGVGVNEGPSNDSDFEVMVIGKETQIRKPGNWERLYQIDGVVLKDTLIPALIQLRKFQC